MEERPGQVVKITNPKHKYYGENAVIQVVNPKTYVLRLLNHKRTFLDKFLFGNNDQITFSILKSSTKSNQELFSNAIEQGELESVIRLSQLNDVDPTADQSIRWASQYGHLPVVKFLVTLPNIDPTAKNNEAIRVASLHGHLPVVRFLATLPNVDPTVNDNQAIKWAKLANRSNVVKYLLAISDFSLDEKASYLELSKDEAKKVVEKEQYKYLKDQKALEICIALNHLSLLEMITIIDSIIKYAENIPHHVKWNFLKNCKHHPSRLQK